MPFLSVILPTFNRFFLLKKAIVSVLNQNYQDWELIIIDDGSNDGTESKIQSFLTDQRIQYFFQSNQGVTKARNFGAEKAKGEFLVFLDSDDLVKPNWLTDFYSVWSENKGHQVFQMGYELILAIKTGSQTFIPKEGKYNPILTGTFMISRKMFLELEGYDNELTFGENSELFFRVEKLIPQIILIPSAQLVYNESLNGCSKNLRNMSQSIKHTLSKHQSNLNPEITRLYLQIVGVNGMRMGNYSEARKYLLKAYSLNPFKIDTLGRFLISCFPFLARNLYPIKEGFL